MEHRGGIGRWLRITFLVVVLVVLAFVGGVAAGLGYVAFNPDALKPVAAYLTERFLGRTLTIDGEVTLDLSLQPRIGVRSATFGNAAWSAHPNMVQVGALEVQIDLADLLDNRVRLLDLDVKDATVLLEDPVDGLPNWSFSSGGSEGEGWSFLLEGLGVTNTTLRAEIGELAPLVVEIPRLIESTDATGNLTLDGEGRLNGERWTVRGHIGTFEALLAAGQINLALDLVVDEIALALTGDIENLQQLAGLDLKLHLSGPDAAVVGSVFRMPEAFSGDVALDASIQPAEDAHRIVVNGHVSQFAVDISGTVRSLTSFDGWNGHLAVEGPDAGVIGKALQLRDLPGGPFRIAGDVQRDGPALDLSGIRGTFAGAELDLSANFKHFPDTRDARIQARLAGEDLRFYRTFLRLPPLPEALPFAIEVALQAGAEHLLNATVTAGSHRLEASGPLGSLPDFDGTRLAISASGAEFSELTKLAGLDAGPTGPYRAGARTRIEQGRFAAESIHLDVDPFRFTGAVEIPDVREPRRVAVNGKLDVRDLVRAGALFQLDNLPAGDLSVTATVASDGRQWQLKNATGQTPVGTFSASGQLGPLPSITGIDLNVEVQGSDIQPLFDHALADAKAIPFTLSSRIRRADGAFELESFRLRALGGGLDLNSRVTTASGFVGSYISLKGQGRDLANLLPSFPAYRPPNQPWQIDGSLRIPSAGHVEIEEGNLRVGSVQLAVAGVVDTRDQDQTNLSLSISGNSIDELGQIGSFSWPQLPFSLDVELDGVTNAITINHLDARWGDSDLTATGAVELAGKPRIVLHGRSKRLKIVELQEAAQQDEQAAEADKPTRYIPDVPLPLDLLARQDLDLSVKAGDFEGRRMHLNDVDIVARIQDGALTLDHLRYRDQQGFFDMTGSLAPSGADAARLVMSVKGEKADLGLFVAPDQPLDTRPTYNLDVSVQGTGTTLAEIAASLDGSVLVWSEGGKINNSIIQTYASDFLVKVLETLNPFTKSEPFTQVQCLVLNAVVDQGDVKLLPGFVMRTANLNMFVVGTVNLGTEQLNLSLATQARQGIGISAATLTNPYFKVGGTLAAPALQLDPQNAAIAASVTAATAGLNIVVRGVWSRLMGEQNPCPRFLNYQRKPES